MRRAGKTVLSKSLSRIEYFDCELPRIRRMMDDPEAFLNDQNGKRIVLDEIHRLKEPSQLLGYKTAVCFVGDEKNDGGSYDNESNRHNKFGAKSSEFREKYIKPLGVRRQILRSIGNPGLRQTHYSS